MSSTESHATISISAQGSMLTLDEDQHGLYSLNLDLGNVGIALQFDATQIRTLGLMCLHHFPDIEPRYPVPEEEEAYRLPMRKISLLDDRSIQILLREVSAEALISFLWYMKDAELAKKFFRNMSQRAAQLLFEDLEGKYGSMNPDKASLAYMEKARRAALEVMNAFDRLQETGEIVRI